MERPCGRERNSIPRYIEQIHDANLIREVISDMRSRRQGVLLNMLLGTGLYLLDSMRDRLAESELPSRARDRYSDLQDRARDRYSDLQDRARDVYDTASDRVSRASDILRGRESHWIGNAAAVVLGIGVGVGVGMLLAPGSGEETRENIAEGVRDRFSRVKEAATGTFGN